MSSTIHAALTKSCPHTIQGSVEEQVQRLYSAGYVTEMVVNVSETLLQKLKAKGKQAEKPTKEKRPPLAVMPYVIPGWAWCRKN